MQFAQKHVAVFVQAYKTAKRGLTENTLPCYYVATMKHGNVLIAKQTDRRNGGYAQD